LNWWRSTSVGGVPRDDPRLSAAEVPVIEAQSQFAPDAERERRLERRHDLRLVRDRLAVDELHDVIGRIGVGCTVKKTRPSIDTAMLPGG
jgi:hypothetical protein